MAKDDEPTVCLLVESRGDLTGCSLAATGIAWSRVVSLPAFGRCPMDIAIDHHVILGLGYRATYGTGLYPTGRIP